MIYLENALVRTFGNEGPYSNYETDPGGETVWGVSRRWNPNLDLWTEVDLWNKKGNPPDSLLKLVTNFYKGKIWVPFRLEEIAKICPELAYSVFDCTVHLWVDQSIPFLQQAINYVGRSKHPQLVVDGWIGDKTLVALDKLRLYPTTLVNVYGILRGNYYLTNGWDGKHLGFINRINFLN